MVTGDLYGTRLPMGALCQNYKLDFCGRKGNILEWHEVQPLLLAGQCFAKFITRLVHQVVRLGSSFANTRIVTSRATRHELQVWQGRACLSQRKASMKLIRSSGTSCRGAEHHQSHQIVHQREHRQLFLNASHRLAAQHIHVQRLLQVPQVRFDLPPLAIQFRQLDGRITNWIQERRDERDLARATARSSELIMQLSDHDRLGQRGSKEDRKKPPQQNLWVSSG
jgi:hypothetical protein